MGPPHAHRPPVLASVRRRRAAFVDMQHATLLAWADYKLKSTALAGRITDLGEDTRDGTVLLTLLQCL